MFRPWARVIPSQVFSHQVEAGGSTLTLKQLMFYGTNLTSVSPEVLVGAIKKLERVEFFSSRMTMQQITAILYMLKNNQQGRLKDIEICMFGYPVSASLLQEARMNTTVRINAFHECFQ